MSLSMARAFLHRGGRRTLPVLPLRQHYHDTAAYGYRVPHIYEMPDYTPEQLDNRSAHSDLLRLVTAYRTFGHRQAQLDPLGFQKLEQVKALDVSRYRFTKKPEKEYPLSGILHVNASESNPASRDTADLPTILGYLKDIYCGRIAYEFTHIPNASERRWFAHRVESYAAHKVDPSREERKRMLGLLTKSEVFDHFMAKKFPQVKRYGLEGAEGMMVVLDQLFLQSARSHIQDLVLCMPHRGRLNLLTDLLAFPPRAVFSKINGKSELAPGVPGTGDVLSHLSNSPTLNYGDDGEVHVTLLPNPSHLEAVNPVAMGKARAKQMDYITGIEKRETQKDLECQLGDRVMCIQLHGDAAFTGQGVVMETFGLSNLPHFSSGGSIHIIINNQIGYTTPALNARSTVYTSDIGKMINAPVIHVNGDYPEEVAKASKIAFEYREKFRKDVILDLVTYRRWGHNELDEPGFTQPRMYENIRSRKSVPKMYEEWLMSRNSESTKGDGAQLALITEEVNALRSKYHTWLEKELSLAQSYEPKGEALKNKWEGYIVPTELGPDLDTGVDVNRLQKIGEGSVKAPADFVIHPRLQKYHIKSRISKVTSPPDKKCIDWPTAEALAWGSLLQDGYQVRISGQDVGRGTFSQRHAMLVDQRTEGVHLPLNSLEEDQGKLEVANSHLSELAVLGFEYGMSLESPKALNIWEAQFGDFFNTAQVIIDTYITGGEAKWSKESGLVMLLPHGYDGAGPEHSSCHIERFLQLTDAPLNIHDGQAANPNMCVANCTTPAQYFHLLRRQMMRPYRKPLILAAPKTLLRLGAASSSLNDMAPGSQFHPVLPDPITKPESVERVVFVSGKLYYDLIKERSAKNLDDKVAFVRVEEICPYPKDAIAEILERYSSNAEVVWCQEEPENAGAYSFILPRLSQQIGDQRTLQYVGRKAYPTPAPGIGHIYKEEQASILSRCFSGF
ncbi:thiamine diphosphate-binding protein [Piptocephalis cylindrospora]|uniref:Thiamine diphosphate-binding protein n=1 Tax=Piptocephalis cylindrospora TaxID=1907219 RepID=A0A4P9Y167_9FUNG|nr:thiamine diphosphate-binding protein [Piptocephalis cylindrospora]|eukprot:RKP12576.1 thiamine diphosphate-binding protein [Piptocephalis cylindrospora]